MRVGVPLVFRAILAIGWMIACCPIPPPETQGPRLVVLIAVDQLRSEYLQRFEPLLTGGLRRLLDEGFSFRRAFHQHAITETAPGHATLSTGRHPSGHGIVSNYWYDRVTGEEIYSVEDAEERETPERLLAPTLGDWLKQRSYLSKVIAIGGKDRAAILLGGKRADGAFWYDGDSGEMTTASYYYRRTPQWLDEFNTRKPLDQRFGNAWEATELSPDQLAQAGVQEFWLGPLRPGFPHALGGRRMAPTEGFYWGVYRTPLLDELVADFALHAVESQGLGLDGHPDLLAISFAALDLVGHRYGPESREVLETVLALDRTLERLLQGLEAQVGRQHRLVVLSADHGVASIPELRRTQGMDARRLDSEVIRCLQGLEGHLREELGPAPDDGRWVRPGPVFANASVGGAGLSAEAVRQVAADYVEACPAVVKAWTFDELAEGGENLPAAGPLFAHSFHSDRSPDLLLQFDEHFLPSNYAEATHGTPYEYDRHVPLMFLLGGVAAGYSDEPVATADLAPTLAALAGIPAPPGLDGRDRSAMMLRPAHEAN